jgi:lysophospholipase L1-like esterase
MMTDQFRFDNPIVPGSIWDEKSDFNIPVVSPVGNGPKGDKGDKGDPFTYKDFTKRQLDQLSSKVASVGNKSEDAYFTTTLASTTTIPIPIVDYDDFDLLFVDVEGLDLAENVDYTIQGSNIVLTQPITHTGVKVHFRALSYKVPDGIKYNLIAPTFDEHIEWDSDRTYQPYTVVTHEGNSFTSKQFVPRGIDINDTRYWVETGNYNAQINLLNAKVETLTQEINNINTPIYLLIGDSYSQGYTPDGSVTSWSDILIQWFSNINIECFKYNHGGYGFTNGGFLQLVNNAVSVLNESQKNRVKKIIIAGGYNDRGKSQTNVNNGISAVSTVIKNNFPNIENIIICPIGMCVEGNTTGVHSDATYAQMVTAYTQYIKGGPLYGCNVMNNGLQLLKNNNYFSSDYVHPNSNGQFIIADAIFNAVQGTIFDIASYYISPTSNSIVIGGSDDYTETSFNYDFWHTNGITIIKPSAITINISIPKSYTLNNNAITIPINKYTAEWQPFNTQLYPVNVIMRKGTTPITYDFAVGEIDFSSSNIKLKLRDISNDGSNFKTIENVNRLMIYFTNNLAFDATMQTSI